MAITKDNQKYTQTHTHHDGNFNILECNYKQEMGTWANIALDLDGLEVATVLRELIWSSTLLKSWKVTINVEHW